MTRKRGARADDDVIQEAMEIFAQGITLTASLRYVGLPYATWHKWLKQDHCQSKERYSFALNCHLEAMSDKTLHVIEQLEADRAVAKKTLREKLAQWHKAHRDHELAMRKWRASDEKTRGEEPFYDGPTEPTYDGPEEWELASTREKLKTWQTHLQSGLERFKKQQTIDHNHTVNQSILHTIDVKSLKTPEEALNAYHKLIEGKIE